MSASTSSEQIISPHICIYKTPGSKNTQSQRRHELLQAIKERRHQSMDEKRNINEVFEDLGYVDEGNQHEEPMEIIATQIKKKSKKIYANKLMLSEWLIEKPLDFEEKWLMKVCPTGVRNIVVANKGKTKCFTKSGHFLAQFQSQLPGGSASTPMKFTILDCIFQQSTNTFYVLDVLVWNSYSVMNSTSEFRFFFIKSKLQECVELQHICKGNEYTFIYTEHRSSDLATIGQIFGSHMDDVDGVLFYHSEVSYLSQITPLVGWLKVYMLSEVLGIPVHSDYYLVRPATYTNFFEYVHNFEKFERKRHRRKHKHVGDIEMTELESDLDHSEGANDAVMEN